MTQVNLRAIEQFFESHPDGGDSLWNKEPYISKKHLEMPIADLVKLQSPSAMRALATRINGAGWSALTEEERRIVKDAEKKLRPRS